MDADREYRQSIQRRFAELSLIRDRDRDTKFTAGFDDVFTRPASKSPRRHRKHHERTRSPNAGWAPPAANAPTGCRPSASATYESCSPSRPGITTSTAPTNRSGKTHQNLTLT